MATGDPHQAGRVLRAGAAPGAARLGLVMLHGRGAGAEDILGLEGMLPVADVTAIAPEAAGRSWWPVSFLEPMTALEPWLGSAVGAADRAIATLEAEGLPRDRIGLVGFSQGACLALEAAARAGGPFLGVWGFSGGLVGTSDAGGPADEALYGRAPKRFDYEGDLAGTPVYLGCHARDPHIPLARVEESERVLEGMGASVTKTIHPGAGHGLLEPDFAALRTAVSLQPNGSSG
ncbi:MAG: dienelactone hydrolase family protein [Pseudomonadota bacterium]